MKKLIFTLLLIPILCFSQYDETKEWTIYFTIGIRVGDSLRVDTIYLDNNKIYGNTDSIIYNAISSHIYEINGTEVMRLDFNGNLCVGCDSAFKRIDARGGSIITTTSDWEILHTGSYLNMKLGTYTGDTYGMLQVGITGGTAGGYLSFNPSGGNVGVATISPDSTFEVVGSAVIGAEGDGLAINNDGYISDEDDAVTISDGLLVTGDIRSNTSFSLGVYTAISENGAQTIIYFNEDAQDTAEIRAGKDIILTTNTTVNDTIWANNYNLNSAKTDYYSINPADFVAGSPASNSVAVDTNSISALANDIYFYAPVHLPHGATVTNAIISGDAAAGAETWSLCRSDFANGSSIMATANINSNDNTISNATIDNSQYSYSIATSSLDNADDIYGGVITFTRSEL